MSITFFLQKNKCNKLMSRKSNGFFHTEICLEVPELTTFDTFVYTGIATEEAIFTHHL